MRGFYVIKGPDHVPTISFCDSLWSKAEERNEKAAEEDTSQHEGYRDLGGASTTTAKRPIRSYYI